MAFLAAFLVSVITGIGCAACFVPGLLVVIFTQFTILFLIDRSQSATNFTSSVALVGSNFVSALLVWLVSVAAIVVGSMVCGIGLLVTVPVAALILTYVYRTLSGGQVATEPRPA
ncbi:hypothetical protein [Mycobacterium tilburgii]|uniref:hypothetical protein n=1 Tax=Mycobacterium tilburgii TaxID=44467 RepID=UPI0016427E15|nr:hypothetical protein [Mycobacterium tilburgii]